MKTVIKIFVSTLLFLFLLNLRYEYYTLIRFLLLGGFILLAFYSYYQRVSAEVISYILLAFLFQPFLRLRLGKELWQLIDISLAIILIVSIFPKKYTLANNMTNKKLIARETLLLTGSIALLFLFWMFLLLRNEYFENKIQTRKNKIVALSSTIDTLSSKAGLLEIYNRKPFYVVYQLNTNEVVVPQKDEVFFLEDNPTAKKVTKSADGLIVVRQYLQYELNGPKNGTQSDTGISIEALQRALNNRRDFVPQVINLPYPKTILELIDFNKYFELTTTSEEYRRVLFSTIDIPKSTFDSIIKTSVRYTCINP